MNIKDLKIVFWGTPEFGALILNKLIINGYKPIAIVTAPDKPAGRRQIIASSPVKELGLKNNILILQPAKIRNNNEIKLQLRDMKPDLFIVAAYGLILPKDIIDLPKFQSINVHPSILPKYRGPSPIQSAILGGDQETGTTLMLIDEQMDHGPILAQREWEFPISNFQFPNKSKVQMTKINSLELTKILAELGADLLIKTLPKWINGEIKTMPQDELKATFTKIIKKEDGKIDWHKSAEQIERTIRAYWPWPSAYTEIKSKNPKLNNKVIKIAQASVLKSNINLPAGSVFLENKKMAVKCGPARHASLQGVAGRQDMLILEQIQLEGKKIISVQDFINGYLESIRAGFICE